MERVRTPTVAAFTRNKLKHLETRKKSEWGEKAKFHFSSSSVNQACVRVHRVYACVCVCVPCNVLCVRVYAFERECVRKFLENASKMNAECNTPATKRIFFFLHVFLSLSLFFGKLLRRYSDPFAQAFQVRFTDIVPEILLCVRPSIDHFFFFPFFFFSVCARKHPETSLCARDWTSRESIERACFLSFRVVNVGLATLDFGSFEGNDERMLKSEADVRADTDRLNNFLQSGEIIPLLFTD